MHCGKYSDREKSLWVSGKASWERGTGDKVRGAGWRVGRNIQAEKTAGTKETRSSMVCVKKSQQLPDPCHMSVMQDLNLSFFS